MSEVSVQQAPKCKYYDDSEYVQMFEEKIKDYTPAEQEAVRMFWRSLVLRNPRVFDENGRLPHHGVGFGIEIGGGVGIGAAATNPNVRSCNCCPYGYHIDLDFVRYCEALANAKPSDEEMQRRSKRRSRKSMEFMLGLDSLFDQWDAADRLAQAVPEASQESEPDSPRYASLCSSTPYNKITRSSSVPRFAYGGSMTRSESPFGTASSTCSSLARGAESDVPYSMRRPAVSPPETRAFLRDALEDVCSDFERTLERTSVRRKKTAPPADKSASFTAMTPLWSDRNNNRPYCADKRNGNAWDQYFDTLDSCVSGNKSPRSSRSYSRSRTVSSHRQPSPAEQRYESYVQATVAANAKSPVEVPPVVLPPPAPQPPRRHASSGLAHTKLLSSPDSSTTDGEKWVSPPCMFNGNANRHSNNNNSSNINNNNSSSNDTPINASPPDAQTLYSIRQQMALSLKRMKDLEEQVKAIPELQNEVSQLRTEKQRLQQTVQRREDELKRAREAARHSSSPSPPGASPKYPSPVQFTPQRISPISLESLGSRIRTSSSSSEKQPKLTILKRDVATNCTVRPTRDIAVGSPIVMQRDVATSPAQKLELNENLYTEAELSESINSAIQAHEQQRVQKQRENVISRATQMVLPKQQFCESGAQTMPEEPKRTHNVGVSARPKTADIFVSCRPLMRSIGSSDDRITDILCEKCIVRKRSVSCGTDDALENEIPRIPVSLKLLDMPPRSNTFSLGENEKLNIKRKTIGTQCPLNIVHTVGSQTSTTFVHSVGVQHVPEQLSASTQSHIESSNRQTDTKDLIRLCTTQTSTEEVSKPTLPPPPPPLPPAPKLSEPKPQMATTASNTEASKTIENGMNTLPPPAKRDSGSNTEEVNKRDIACGDIVKPHISIACADNYCDSCKDAIKNLAKDFSKVSSSPVPIRAVESKIPRPRHLVSPSPVRKHFKRQNTYTITPSPTPTPSPVAEKRAMSSSLHERPPLSSFHQLDSSGESQSFISEPLRQPERTIPKPRSAIVKQTIAVEKPEEAAPVKTPNDDAVELELMNKDGLIVREEKRVTVNWSRSRDASPAEPREADSPLKMLDNPCSEKLIEVSNEEDSSESITPSPDVSKGARKKTMLPKSSQSKSPAAIATEPVAASTSATASTSAPLNEELCREQESASVPSKEDGGMEAPEPRKKYTPPEEMLAALKLINGSLLKKMNSKSLSSHSLSASKNTIQQEWFRVSSSEHANPHEVEDYLDCFEALSVPMLEYCVNMVDNNGNTAMHYAVSHGNFDVVSILLDSKVCNVNQMNNAGYTCVMLVSLAKLTSAAHRTVVERLFQMADVNIRAKKHCQTALMLAVSHGNKDMVSMLLMAGADVNIQDEDGSTALMCAAEHGRVDIVKLLLSEPDCDSLKQDVDGSTAFRIAWQAGHREVGLLLYVHEQMLRSKMPSDVDIQRKYLSSSRLEKPPSP